jgi:DNA-binding transcriptional LysR family regulator
LAEELHFGRAAGRLNVVQPALSRSIKVLEEGLGVKLLNRSSRHVGLTPAGTAFLLKAREALAHFDEAALVAQRVEAGEDMPLRIGFGASIMYRTFPEALRRFHQQYDRSETFIVEDTPERVISGLNSGSLDLAVVQKGYVPGPPIDSRPLHAAGLVAAIPAGWILAKREQLQLRELNGLPFIFFPPNASPMIYALTSSVCSRCGLVPRIAQTAQSINIIMTLVANGLGYSLMNDSVRSFPVHGITFVQVSDPEAQNLFQYEIAWQSSAPAVPRRFLAILQEVMADGAVSAGVLQPMRDR